MGMQNMSVQFWNTFLFKRLRVLSFEWFVISQMGVRRLLNWGTFFEKFV